MFTKKKKKSEDQMSLEEHALEGHAQQEYDQLMLQFAKQQQTMFSTLIG